MGHINSGFGDSFGAGTIVLTRIINLFKGDKILNKTQIKNLILYGNSHGKLDNALTFLVKYKFLRTSELESKSPRYKKVTYYKKGAVLELWTHD